ncbi:MAG: thymidylate synthase [Bacilli bacterium]|nr:thymidylate synthase [Bacilli bacterium]
MSKWDREYLSLCKKILNEGIKSPNRTGIDTYKIPAHHFHLDVGEEFPILTTKQTYSRQAFLEMLWIYQQASNDVRDLQNVNVHIWDEWEIAEDGYWYADQYKTDKEGNQVLEFSKKYFGKDLAHTIGTAYGYVVRKYDLANRAIKLIKEDPFNRRNVISLWQEADLETGVLKPCVWSSEWDVTDGKLNAWVHQRSCDVPLGLPFNVTQYSALLYLFAKEAGLEPGTLDWSIKDAQIYENQVDGIKQQLERENLEDLPAPTLWINPEKHFGEYDFSKDCKDIKVLNYKHHGPVRFPIAK